jgi:hypothetical protein
MIRNLLPPILLISLLVLAPPHLHGQAPAAPFQSDAQTLIQQGNLVSIKIVKGEPLKIFVFGRKEAEVNLSAINFDLNLDPSDFSMSVRRIGSKKLPKILKFTREDDHFVVTDPASPENIYTLEVTTKHRGKKEVFNFKIKNKLH